jgi:hypothetical protein
MIFFCSHSRNPTLLRWRRGRWCGARLISVSVSKSEGGEEEDRQDEVCFHFSYEHRKRSAALRLDRRKANASEETLCIGSTVMTRIKPFLNPQLRKRSSKIASKVGIWDENMMT